MSASELALFGGRPIRTTPFPAWPVSDAREEALVLDALRSGNWWRYAGGYVHQFEQAFAQYHDARFGIAVASGTLALEAAIWALQLEPGDEVLVPSYTFVASVTAIIRNGLKPRFVDVDPGTLNIDLEHAAGCISPKTRAIVVVHFGGLPCNMEAVKAFALRHRLMIVEDAAHAHGAKWNGQGVGSLGHVSAFSFQASKNMTCGEGGLVATNDGALFERIFAHHTHGRHRDTPWYSHHVVSTNMRLTELQASILLAQLERLEEQTNRRLQNARRLDAALEAIPGLHVIGSDDPRAAKRAYHLYPLRIDVRKLGASRDRVVEALQAEGIPCSAGYPMPLYAQPMVDQVTPPLGHPPYRDLDLPQVSRLCDEVLWIRQNALLGGVEDANDVIRAVEKVMANLRHLRG